MQRIKHVVFRHYWWVVVVLAAVVMALSVNGLLFRESQTLIATLGGLFSLAFFVQKQKLDELKLFRELFSDFNARYDKVNEHVERIAKSGVCEKGEEEKLVEYFNLCGEEYFWFSAGLIPEIVWSSWCRGMLEYLSKEPLARMWDSEEKKDSYYGLTRKVIEGGARSNKNLQRTSE